MTNSQLKHLFAITISIFCLAALPFTAQAARTGKSQQVQKERLVLMPLRLSEEDRSLQGAMESALAQGLQQKYEVFSGEQVAQKAKEIFNKESHSTKKECDETRCMQGIAEAFQAELIATANITKRDDGYFLALSVQNIFDNKLVYSNSLPCKSCDAYQVVDKLKELSGVSGQAASAADSTETPAPSAKANDPESALWGEVQKGNSVDDYAAYLAQYPKGKFVALAKSRMKKLQELAASELAQQDQSAWDSASGAATEASYAEYQKNYPQGRYAALATARIAKLKKEAAEATARGPQPGKTYKDCADCPEVVMVPAGSFDMGSPGTETGRNNNEGPVHRVNVKPFLLGKTHITKGQFAAFVYATSYDAGSKCWVFEGQWKEREGGNWRNLGYAQEDNHPASCINRNDAKAYADWLSRKSGKSYRLPTEAEWEYAARAGTTTTRFWGENLGLACGYANALDKSAQAQISGALSWAAFNCTDGYAYTLPVGSLKPNAFGLYDMQGNVWQWVEDSYHDSYNGAPSDGTEWSGDTTKYVLRGGSWLSSPDDVRSAKRIWNDPVNRSSYTGFRLARTLP